MRRERERERGFGNEEERGGEGVREKERERGLGGRGRRGRGHEERSVAKVDCEAQRRAASLFPSTGRRNGYRITSHHISSCVSTVRRERRSVTALRITTGGNSAEGGDIGGEQEQTHPFATCARHRRKTTGCSGRGEGGRHEREVRSCNTCPLTTSFCRSPPSLHEIASFKRRASLFKPGRYTRYFMDLSPLPSLTHPSP